LGGIELKSIIACAGELFNGSEIPFKPILEISELFKPQTPTERKLHI
jgi:hypothetical protein